MLKYFRQIQDSIRKTKRAHPKKKGDNEKKFG